MGDVELHPCIGNVAFGTGQDCWGFTLKMFAKNYATKLNIPEVKILKKLWGDNFYNPSTKKWTTKPYDKEGKPLKRGFVQFVMDPILNVAKICEENDQ